MLAHDTNALCQPLKENIRDKTGYFAFNQITLETVEKMLLSRSEDSSPGAVGLDGKIIKIAARLLCKPLYHILNRRVFIRGSERRLKHCLCLKMKALVSLVPTAGLLVFICTEYNFSGDYFQRDFGSFLSPPMQH